MRRGIKKLSLLLLAVFILLPAAGCKNSPEIPAAGGIASSPFDGEKIVVHGLQDSDFEITAGELKKLGAVTRNVEASRASGEKIKLKATGPLLDTFLQKYGRTQKDFTAVRFSARDNYSIAVPADILKNRQIILAYINDGRQLEAEDRPVRVVIPGERAMYWVRMLKRIDFETGESARPCKKAVLLETAVKDLPQEDYSYYDSVDKAVKTRDLVDRYVGADDGSMKNVFMLAGDGLKKNETKENFLSAFIKITGLDQPKFLAPQFPQGMHIRDLLCLNYDTTAFFSVSQGSKVLERRSAGARSGVGFWDIIKKVGMVTSERYRVTGADGTSAELEASELAGGLVYQEDDGALMFISGEPPQKTVRDALLIEALS